MNSSRTVLLVVVCALISQLGTARPPEAVDTPLVEQSLVRLVRLPVVFEERSPGACDRLASCVSRRQFVQRPRRLSVGGSA